MYLHIASSTSDLSSVAGIAIDCDANGSARSFTDTDEFKEPWSQTSNC
jgi:hypothetical protein